MQKREKNTAGSVKIVTYYTGYIIRIIAFLMIIPIITSLCFKEWNVVLDFVITLTITLSLSLLLIMGGMDTKRNNSTLQWKHGLAVAALSWLGLTVLCAIPYYLSGHTLSFLDASFDVMSGFTTTGVMLAQDLDHISNGLNMWRHMITFIGGQGMVVLALSFLTRETGGAYKMYVGEGKDIELLPNVKGTTRQIWKISISYLFIGTIALWIVGMSLGLKPISALLQGLYMFESSWSTGGFAPYSQNIMYYHSFIYESVAMIIFILGSFNFGLHYAVWQGKKRELIKNIEIQSFLITAFILSVLAVTELERKNIYPDAISTFRRVVFNVISAHTTTGLGSIYARQFILEWGDFGILILIITMLIGGSACSTAGGFKGLRMGIVFKGLIADVKKLLLSDRNVKIFKFHYMKERVLEDNMVKSALLIIICYIVTFVIGTLLGTYYGYPLADSAFESASITGNVGLSIGITSASMPTAMKVYDIVAMYLGRLEFLSVFAFIGYIGGGVSKICRKYIK
jgi:trk system potassium uptake protein TrkH